MQILKDSEKSTSDKQNSFNVFNEMIEKNIVFSSNPKDFFSNFNIDLDIKEDINYDNLEVVKTYWNNAKHDIIKNNEFDIASKNSIQNAEIEDFGVQRVTYLIDDNEDYQAILNALKMQKTNALFRAVTEDESKREITVYSSRFGIWKDPNNEFRAKLNTGAETNGQIRYTFTARGQRDINSLVNMKKGFNYAVYEDLENLFEKDLIQNVNGIITKSHLKIELSDEDLKQVEIQEVAKKEVVKETSHTNSDNTKSNAKTSEMIKTIENNENEIISKDDREIPTKKEDLLEDLEEERIDLVNEFLVKQMKDLEEKQALEKAMLQEKINSTIQQRAKIKQDAIILLQNGMSLQDMNLELQAKKYNDLQIKIINEELKKEIIDSVVKEKELKEVSKELTTYINKAETYKKSKDYFKSQFENMQKNLSEEQANHKLTKLEYFNVTKMLENSTIEFESQKQLLLSANQDLKEEKVNLQKEYDFIEAEIEEKIEDIHEKEKSILLLENKVTQKDEIIDEKNKTITQKDETIKIKDSKIETLFEEKTELKNQVFEAESEIKDLKEEIEKNRRETQAIIGSLKSKNDVLFKENAELKEQLANYQELKKELEQFKKNAKINMDLKSNTEEVKSFLKQDEAIIKDVKNTDIFKSKLDEIEKKDLSPKFNFEFNPQKNNNNNNNNNI